MTTIIDYGIGNLRSLAKAFDAAGVPTERTGDPARIAAAERLVLPGVGAFGACADELAARGLTDVVRERARAGVPLLGVCVGMQLLFESSDERPGPDGRPHAGLGLLPGRVVRFAPALADADGRRLKVPHMGWNRLRTARPHPVLDDAGGADGGDWVYFVHSYHAAPTEPADVRATAGYGGDVPAVVGRGTVVGVQFHPEKSARAGLAMLRRFASWTPTPDQRLA
ncbi:imidazole glycerol phosphate synthase subunit HisH [Rubrivirga sp.]|uniref:imidazole glycerol phosphate synthase subunit HisH n=1 Tax=Rubrivirga sp. TaxID=1885344 RepID=UPI003B52DCF6